MTTPEKLNMCILSVQTVLMVLGFIFVTRQFRTYVSEISKTHDWNRRKASQETCYNFMESRVQESWQAIYKQVVEERKVYEQLTPEEQAKMRLVIYYFENLGISIKNNIVDRDIIWDYFGSVWPISYECCKIYVEAERKRRSDDMIYENFVEVALEFAHKHEVMLAAVPREPNLAVVAPLKA